MDKKVGIIGSGIAGLVCAQVLQRAGVSVFVLDKGRGPGGRMCTRNRGQGKWDHGAQYFTARDARFQSLVAEWEKEKIAKAWFELHPTKKEASMRYVGKGGINTIAQYLAKDLDVRQSSKVHHIHDSGSHWVLETEDGTAHNCEELVLTPPIPQAVELLKKSSVFNSLESRALLESVEYEKGLSVLAVLDGPSLLPSPGCLKNDNSILSWICDNGQKGISSAGVSITLQSNPLFAKEHWDRSDSERGMLLINAGKQYLGSEVIDFHCHAWGFAFAINPLLMSHYRSTSKRLSIAGDGFYKSRVESAALSGIASAEAILESLK